jgi:hypothetical protein
LTATPYREDQKINKKIIEKLRFSKQWIIDYSTKRKINKKIKEKRNLENFVVNHDIGNGKPTNTRGKVDIRAFCLFIFKKQNEN